MQISFSLINTLNLLSNDHFQGLQHFIQIFSYNSPNQTPQKRRTLSPKGEARAEPKGRSELVTVRSPKGEGHHSNLAYVLEQTPKFLEFYRLLKTI